MSKMSSSSFQSSKQCQVDSQHLHSYLSGNGVVTNHHQNLVEIVSCRNLNEIKSIRQSYSALCGQELLHAFASTQRNNPFAVSV
ncbi:Annexin repeat [Trema orientale]|uniref:Annexin repeat n=1 Tax=Trema orientale TaxID=63057 RepID=A0A2P5ARA5_TREOI|nr:Annexin repeat [Trema orientale]